MARGRPSGQMTHRRQQVLEAYTGAALQGEVPTMARVARACGLHDYRKVRRIVRDLRKLGRLN